MKSLALLLLPFAANASYKVYYTPVDVHTLVAIKPSAIEKQAYFKFDLNSTNLDSLFDAASRPSSERVPDRVDIRAKIVNPESGKAIYLTRRMTLTDGEKQFSVDQKILDGVFQELEATRKMYCADHSGQDHCK